MNATIARIMAICDNTPDPAAHRHHLEQLPPAQLQQRLADLLESEQRHGLRDGLPPRNINQDRLTAIHA